jgi:hypothetical protein
MGWRREEELRSGDDQFSYCLFGQKDELEERRK